MPVFCILLFDIVRRWERPCRRSFEKDRVPDLFGRKNVPRLYFSAKKLEGNLAGLLQIHCNTRNES
jgi:hypothetical protein